MRFSVQKLTAAALLIALGIVIPMLSPIRLVMGPASFTLASHVPIFLAMFISPGVAAAVAVGTTLGFFLGGFHLIIVLRAATHLIFSVAGAFYLQQRKGTLSTPARSQAFSFVVGVVHAVAEVIVVTFFYFGGSVSPAYYENGFVVSVLLLVGLGGLIHSMLDFLIALLVAKPLAAQRSTAALFPALQKHSDVPA